MAVKKITCPYFIRCGRSRNKFTLLCEGIIGTERRLFCSYQERNRWLDKMCAETGACPLQAALNERYNGEIKNSLDNDISL